LTASTRHRDYELLTRSLRETRARLGLTQAELAERLGNSQAFVSKVERGERRLDVVELVEFCEALKVPIDDWIKAYIARRAEQQETVVTKPKTAK